MNGPLSGIRVFDLTRVLAGPSCVQILGDLGAEVIKVEQPNVGDDTRKFGPPFLKDMDGNDTTESGYYMATNRNKKSLTLNLTSKKGQDIARQLISKSDILVENFKVGNLSKYNLSYDNLRDEYPSLIYCSITGFGQTGPLAEQPGYDFMAQGMGGLMSVTGPKDGEPHRVGVPIADLTAGLWATIGICAAVRHKEKTGEGQHLDISLLDTQVASLSIQGLNYLTSGDVPQLLGNAHPNIVPYQVFPVADGDIIIAVGNDNQFDRFAKFINMPELATDERFSTNDKRVINREILTQILNEKMLEKKSSYWLTGLEKIGISAGPINKINQVFENEQVLKRGMKIEMNHDLTDTVVNLIGNPIHMSATPPTYRCPPPILGQHTDEILTEILEIPLAKITELKSEGVI
ncbi:MAG: Acetyl-CoA:oxalate CoA-transferase [Alphaproteobacteria bacterium MarineAlpha3_Bin7]|nr:MAG: Acetyl-CoA:oxalate CoA-transferase [Alphaproteobacteria bacterium MarineAlpha3_Bin7]|tara:strand:- start:61 stop:1275 length:1215 start_codon:yes stop_codon:yes gene_type:complete